MYIYVVMYVFGRSSVINIIQHILSFITKYDVLTNTCVTLKYNIYALKMNVSHYLNNISNPIHLLSFMKNVGLQAFVFNADYVNIFLMH